MGKTPTAAATATTMSREELKASVDDLIDEIVNGGNDHWEAYAARLAEERTMGAHLGMFQKWSVNNMFYLHAQVARRQESVKGLYAGVAQWRKRGRSVRDGEKPYVIFGAPSYRVRDPKNQQQAGQPAAAGSANAANTQPGQQQNQQQGHLVFRRPPTIEVYDWTQTVADDPDYVEPDWGVPLAYGDLDTLHGLAAVSPVPVNFRDIGSRNEHGWLDADGITVDSTMPIGNQIFTLVHEQAHFHLGHLEKVNSTAIPDGSDDELCSTYAVCEQEAALTQFLAMKMLGLDEAAGNNVTEAAGSYLRSWLRVDQDGKTVPVEGHKTKRKLVLKRFDAAFKAADKIVAAYLQQREGSEELDATA